MLALCKCCLSNNKMAHIPTSQMKTSDETDHLRFVNVYKLEICAH